MRRTEEMFKRFTPIHNKSAVKRVVKERIKPKTLNCVFELFNQYITWASTEEGYVYYYTLNLRWVLYLTYVCHEEFPGMENFCIQKLKKFVNYSTTTSNYKCYDEKEYLKKREIFLKKIKKIEEIFGNKK